jgi:hypothetical protein
MSKANPKIAPMYCVKSVKPAHAKLSYAAHSNLIIKRSPRVVDIGRNPFLSKLGDLTCQIVIPINIIKTLMKKIAIGVVDAIHERDCPIYTLPIAKPLAM